MRKLLQTLRGASDAPAAEQRKNDESVAENAEHERETVDGGGRQEGALVRPRRLHAGQVFHVLHVVELVLAADWRRSRNCGQVRRVGCGVSRDDELLVRIHQRKCVVDRRRSRHDTYCTQTCVCDRRLSEIGRWFHWSNLHQLSYTHQSL